jgi:hypothetical protein
MKRVFTCLIAFCIASNSYFTASAAVSSSTALPVTANATVSAADPGVLRPSPVMKATDLRLPVGHTGKFINLQDLATIKVADFEKMTGKKMGFLRRMEFKLAQRDLRHSINKDGTVDSKKLARLASGYYDDDNSFHFGGFALGFFLGLIGILIAYLINDDNHHRRVKWAWWGFGIWIALLLVIVAAAA